LTSSRRPRIGVALFHGVDRTILTYLSNHLPSVFEYFSFIPVDGEIPVHTVSPRRSGEFLAHDFLVPLRDVLLRERLDIAVGLTDLDLFVSGLNFVFGLAHPVLRTAVVSLARLDESFYGRPPNVALLQRRVLTEVVHEVGHILGLGHCRNPRCAMFFSNSLRDTDLKGPVFCNVCRAHLEQDQ